MTLKNKFKWIKSLRTQSFCVLLLVGILPLVVFSTILMNTYRSKAVAQRVSELEARGTILCNLVISSAFFSNDSTEEVESELTQVSDIYDGRILVVNTNLVVLKDTYGLEEGKTLIIKEVVDCIKTAKTVEVNSAENREQIIIPVLGSDGSTSSGAVIMDCSMNSVTKMYENIKTISLTLILLLGVIVIVTSILYSGQVVKPIVEASASIAHITQGDFNETLELTKYTELEDMQDKFNTMLSGLQNLEDARQEFVSNVSHELKTPLTSISGYAELIETGMASEQDTVRFAHGIHNSANRLLTLINDIIRLSELDGTEEEADTELLNLHEMAQNCVEMLKMSAEKHKVTIALNGTECYVTANRQMMEELLYNLCDNAIRYNNPGGSVDVQTYAREGHTYLVVKDTGIGISKEHQERIFERFYRVDKSHSKASGGTGLGLSIAQEILNQHKGSIEISSEYGKGTSVLITMPAAEAQA